MAYGYVSIIIFLVGIFLMGINYHKVTKRIMNYRGHDYDFMDYFMANMIAFIIILVAALLWPLAITFVLGYLIAKRRSKNGCYINNIKYINIERRDNQENRRRKV